MLRPILRRPQGVQLFAVCVVTLIALASHRAIAGRQNSTMTRLFAPVDIEVDISRLSDSERRALAHIIAAARVMDSIFLQQVWAGNPSMLLSLGARAASGPINMIVTNVPGPQMPLSSELKPGEEGTLP